MMIRKFKYRLFKIFLLYILLIKEVKDMNNVLHLFPNFSSFPTCAWPLSLLPTSSWLRIRNEGFGATYWCFIGLSGVRGWFTSSSFNRWCVLALVFKFPNYCEIFWDYCRMHIRFCVHGLGFRLPVRGLRSYVYLSHSESLEVWQTACSKIIVLNCTVTMF